MPSNVARSIMDAHREGTKQNADIMVHRLQSTAVAFHATQTRNKSKHVDSTKEDMHVLGHLCMTLDVREGHSDRPFKALPAFHGRTGSDNTFLVSGTEKKSAYAKWSTRPELTTTLCHLMDKPETPSSDGIAVIESFVISLCSVSCTLTDVNQARQQIYAQSSRTFEYMYLPPTKTALVEHVKRTTHQSGYVWGQSIIAMQVS